MDIRGEHVTVAIDGLRLEMFLDVVKIEVAPTSDPVEDEVYPKCSRTLRFTTARGEAFELTCQAEGIEQLQIHEVTKLQPLPKPNHSLRWVRPKVWKPTK